MVQAWNTSWYPKTPGTGFGPLEGIDDRPGRVGQAAGQQQGEPGAPRAWSSWGSTATAAQPTTT